MSGTIGTRAQCMVNYWHKGSMHGELLAPGLNACGLVINYGGKIENP